MVSLSDQEKMKEAARRAQQKVADANVRQGPKPKTCQDCGTHVECFNKPDGVSDEDFNAQLKEQQNAINNTTADELVERRDAYHEAGGTKPLRVPEAQKKVREQYESALKEELLDQGLNVKQPSVKSFINDDMKGLAATHELDIIAGGDPSQISGMQNKRVNGSIGPQWRGRRSQDLEDYARDMQRQGRGGEGINVELKNCDDM